MGEAGTKEQVKEIVERVKRQAIVRKWSLPETVFIKIVREVIKDSAECALSELQTVSSS